MIKKFPAFTLLITYSNFLLIIRFKIFRLRKMSKNYPTPKGLFPDELCGRFAPLPRCTLLPSVVGSDNKRVSGSFRCTHSPKFAPLRSANFRYPPTVMRNSGFKYKTRIYLKYKGDKNGDKIREGRYSDREKIHRHRVFTSRINIT